MLKESVLGLMGLGYLIIGIFTIYTKYFIVVPLEPLWANILGVLFIVYGIFRVIRAYKNIRNEKF